MILLINLSDAKYKAELTIKHKQLHNINKDFVKRLLIKN